MLLYSKMIIHKKRVSCPPPPPQKNVFSFSNYWLSPFYSDLISFYKGAKMSCTNKELTKVTFPEIKLVKSLTLRRRQTPKVYLSGGFTQTKNLSIIWLRFQLMHTLFLLEGQRFPLATSGGLCSPGAVTVSLHTRMNLKKQVNCCSLRINRAIYSACLSDPPPPSSVSPFLHPSALSFSPACRKRLGDR